MLLITSSTLESTKPPPADCFTRRIHPSNQRMQRMKWGPGEREVHEAVCNAAMASGRHQVLGWRDLSYDGEQRPRDALLFQCTSDHRAQMEWGDLDQLFFYLPRTALAKGDFSRVTVCCGE